MKNFRNQMLADEQEAKNIRNAVLNMSLKVASSLIEVSQEADEVSKDYVVAAFVMTDKGSGLGVQQLLVGTLAEDTNALRAAYNYLRNEVAVNGQALSNPIPEEDDQYLATVSFGGLSALDAKLLGADGKALTGEGVMVTVNFVDDTHALFVVEAADGAVRFGITSGDTDVPLIKADLQPVSNPQKTLQSVLDGADEELKLLADGDYNSNFWAALVSGISTASPSEHEMFPTFTTDA